jgi:membrane peptidoglycan carboxypeptidase
LNDNRKYNYGHTIFRGVVSSVNAVAANTLERAGIAYSFEFARDKFGLSTLIESYTDSNGEEHTDIAVGPLAIGAQTWGVKVRDMANGFSTFANNGYYRNARTFTKVYDSNGKLILDNVQNEEQILSEKTVNYMNYCLANATASGTGTEAKLRGFDTAGKTGTTGSNKDRWYCGFTGHYTAAVWCGFDTPAVIRPYNVNNPSAVLFRKVMTPVHQGLSNVKLYNTSNMVSATMCVDSGKNANSACSIDVRGNRTESALLYPEDRIGGGCTKHVAVEYCSGGGVATEYCHMFADADGSATFKQKGLLKVTQSELSKMLAPGSYMPAEFRQDNYIYLIDSDGDDAVFRGIKGNLKQWKDAPYLICPVHTKSAWETYEAEKATEPEETLPMEPTPDDNPQDAPSANDPAAIAE